MSQENVEVVRRSIEAWNRRDATPALAFWTSDAEMDWSRATGPFKGVYCGHHELEVLLERENGQLIRLRMFQERAEALEAVGLSE